MAAELAQQKNEQLQNTIQRNKEQKDLKLKQYFEKLLTENNTLFSNNELQSLSKRVHNKSVSLPEQTTTSAENKQHSTKAQFGKSNTNAESIRLLTELQPNALKNNSQPVSLPSTKSQSGFHYRDNNPYYNGHPLQIRSIEKEIITYFNICNPKKQYKINGKTHKLVSPKSTIPINSTQKKHSNQKSTSISPRPNIKSSQKKHFFFS